MRAWRNLPVALALTLLSTLALWGGLAAAQSAATCRQALALGLDVSRSVDPAEYRLQLDGLARALLDPEVQEAILASPGVPVTLAIYEWSGPEDQRILVPWTEVRRLDTLLQIAWQLNRTQRSSASPSTSIGAAMLFGADLLNQRRECLKRTLDLSGDGQNNSGATPLLAKRHASLTDITVNALVIGADSQTQVDIRQVQIGELVAYFRSQVIHGPGAFVEAALGFTDFERAMVRKLRRELQGVAISELAPEGMPRRSR